MLHAETGHVRAATLGGDPPLGSLALLLLPCPRAACWPAYEYVVLPCRFYKSTKYVQDL